MARRWLHGVEERRARKISPTRNKDPMGDRRRPALQLSHRKITPFVRVRIRKSASCTGDGSGARIFGSSFPWSQVLACNFLLRRLTPRALPRSMPLDAQRKMRRAACPWLRKARHVHVAERPGAGGSNLDLREVPVWAGRYQVRARGLSLRAPYRSRPQASDR